MRSDKFVRHIFKHPDKVLQLNQAKKLNWILLWSILKTFHGLI